jgi:hypothetical protein
MVLELVRVVHGVTLCGRLTPAHLFSRTPLTILPPPCGGDRAAGFGEI